MNGKNKINKIKQNDFFSLCIIVKIYFGSGLKKNKNKKTTHLVFCPSKPNFFFLPQYFPVCYFFWKSKTNKKNVKKLIFFLYFSSSFTLKEERTKKILNKKKNEKNGKSCKNVFVIWSFRYNSCSFLFLFLFLGFILFPLLPPPPDSANFYFFLIPSIFI